MQYVVELDDAEEHRVELRETDRGEWRAVVGDDQEIELELRGISEDGAFVVDIDGERREFQLDRDATSCYLTDDRDMVDVTVDRAGDVVIEYADPDRRGELDLGRVESPITGVTVDVQVEEGDRVDEGDDLVVVEAMKMENTIDAPVDGRVTDVDVDAGERVFTGDQLVAIAWQDA